MRRTLLGSLVAAAVLLIPTTASAASSTVVSRVGIPSPFAFNTDANSCGTGPFTASAKHVHGPATPPLGSGSLRLTVGKKSAADLTASVSGDQMTDLHALSVSSYVPTGSASMSKNVVISTQPVSSTYYQGATALPGAVKEWTPLDLLNNSVNFTWTFYDHGTPSSAGSSSYSTFAGAHASLLLDTIGISATNCGTAAQSFNVDDLTLGLKTTTTTYNFETSVATQLVGHISKRLIGYHKAVTPTAKLTAGSNGLGGKSVSLWQKPAGSKKYHKIGTLVTSANGALTGPVQHPRVNTAYQWRYAGDTATHSPATSKPNHVAVRSKIGLALERKSVANGQPVAGGGAVTPRHAHLKITLWARKVTGSGKHQSIGTPVKVANTKLRRDGTYTISGKLATGHYKVYTSSAADSRNAAGHSKSRNFTVR
jgi:hypothetical protein